MHSNYELLIEEDDAAMSMVVALDKNKDGKIEPDEVPAEKKKFFDRLLRLGDKNKDGILAKEEFGTATKEPEAPKGELRGFDAGPGRGPNLEELFERADRNKDGKLSKDELPERLRERLAPLFEKTGKEEITKEELARFSMRAKAGAGAAAQHLYGQQRAHGRYDYHADPALYSRQREERRAPVSPQRAQTAHYSGQFAQGLDAQPGGNHWPRLLVAGRSRAPGHAAARFQAVSRPQRAVPCLPHVRHDADGPRRADAGRARAL